MTKTLGTLTLFVALALAGCAAATNKSASTCCDDSGAKAQTASASSTNTTEAKPTGRVMVVNSICPIGGDDFDSKDRPAELTRTVNGETIGFCCEHCTAKFDKMTDSQKAGVLAAAKSNKPL